MMMMMVHFISHENRPRLEHGNEAEVGNTYMCVFIRVINASAAVTLLEQRPEKNSGSERDPLRA